MSGWTRRVEEALGAAVASFAPLAGGCVGEVYRARLSDGRDIVVKVDGRAEPRLDIEGRMLSFLAETGTIPVPEVLHASPRLLAMTLLPGGSRFSPAAEAHAAELLAALHAIRGAAHGLPWDTLIGGLPQPNAPCASWVDFYRDRRLLPMADRALEEGALPRGMHRRLAAFCGRLDGWLEEPEHPSLLHGDVWTTNVLAVGGRVTGFLDPAVYFGHPEVELAFITLFHTFGEAFFGAYGALRPVRPGFFELRRDIYTLYPLLVHVRLFGASYLSGVDNTLRRHGF
ncbi:MAG TPA: fructosamine kinase family protein [Candidatus Hydrogenedentes bacterium]|nr:fructosamine kinase family protein [Candidatus Hydrogenedentota bacterium]